MNFLGDKVTSYGGFLKFRVNSSGDSQKIPDNLLKKYPLVQIHAHDLLILEYHEVLTTYRLFNEIRLLLVNILFSFLFRFYHPIMESMQYAFTNPCGHTEILK